MKDRVRYHLETLLARYPQLLSCREDIIYAFNILKKSFENGHKLIVCGNGGSSSDAEHIVGELMKGFRMRRRIKEEQANNLRRVNEEIGTMLVENLQEALPAISLTSHTSLTSAIINDCESEVVFAQQVNGYGKIGDCFWGISTSGNSMNVLYASVVAKAKGLNVIGLTGDNKNKLMEYADVCIRVPEEETYKIQELHLPVYHCLCLMLEEYFFEE